MQIFWQYACIQVTSDLTNQVVLNPVSKTDEKKYNSSSFSTQYDMLSWHLCKHHDLPWFSTYLDQMMPVGEWLKVKHKSMFRLERMAIKQYRSHLWIAGANHDELGWMYDTDAFPLYCIHTWSRTVKHHIDKTIIEKIDFVNIQYPPVCLSLQRDTQFLIANDVIIGSSEQQKGDLLWFWGQCLCDLYAFAQR